MTYYYYGCYCHCWNCKTLLNSTAEDDWNNYQYNIVHLKKPQGNILPKLIIKKYFFRD